MPQSDAGSVKLLLLGATGLVGSRVHFIPLSRDRGFLPDLSAVPRSVLASAKLMETKPAIDVERHAGQMLHVDGWFGLHQLRNGNHESVLPRGAGLSPLLWDEHDGRSTKAR